MKLALHNGRGRSAAKSIAVGAITAAVAGAGLVAARRLLNHRELMRPQDAPEKTLHHGDAGNWRERTVVGRSVTINRPRKELYAFWRRFSNLAKFMENVRSVTEIDDKRSRWVIASPAGEVEFETTITEERAGELIAWQSDEDATIRNSGRVEFRDAPGKRGTQVEATIAYDAPGGVAGRLIAKLFQREPHIQARRELKRFKQLMETGEIATSDFASGASGTKSKSKETS